MNCPIPVSIIDPGFRNVFISGISCEDENDIADDAGTGAAAGGDDDDDDDDDDDEGDGGVGGEGMAEVEGETGGEDVVFTKGRKESISIYLLRFNT
jgi:hypothetical protein